MADLHPSDGPTPPHVTLFDATESQLIDELKRRNNAVVVITERDALGSSGCVPDTFFTVDYRGGFTTVFGLVCRAKARLEGYINRD